MNKKTVKDIDLKGKRVFMRVDFNVPKAEGIVTDDKRIKAALPTIKFCLEQGASLLLASHLGRPKGGPDPEFSLRAASEVLSTLLNRPVKMAPDCVRPKWKRWRKPSNPVKCSCWRIPVSMPVRRRMISSWQSKWPRWQTSM